METIEKNENRDLTISLKVTNDEKEILQRMADETGLSLSDFIRRKAAAEEKFFEQLLNENTKLKEENKDLKVKSSFGLPRAKEGSVTIDLSPAKQEAFNKLLMQMNVMVNPNDEDSEIRPLTLGERIELTLDMWLTNDYYIEYNEMFYKQEPRILHAIRTGEISLELAEKAYPNRTFILK